MAEELDDGEFWLPSQFLTDDDILKDFAVKKDEAKEGREFLGFGSSVSELASFGVSSDLSSPGESVTGSTETESDEDELMASLTRDLARSTLDDYAPNPKGWVLSGSPQSTLCAVGRGCDCNQGSSRGSPNGPVSPPAAAAAKSDAAAFDLLYAAAGEVARMRIQGTGFFDSSNRAVFYGNKKSNAHVSLVPPQDTIVDYSALYSRQLQASQQLNHHLKQRQQQQQWQQQGVWGQVKPTARMRSNSNYPPQPQPQPQHLSLSAFPPLQRQSQRSPQGSGGAGTGTRAFPMGAAGPKRECAGTGVFLPRRIGTPTDSRKKPASPTVVIPAKVVHALNNINSHSHYPPRLNPNFSADSDGALKFRSPPQRRSSPGSLPANSLEIQLPQDWTY